MSIGSTTILMQLISVFILFYPVVCFKDDGNCSLFIPSIISCNSFNKPTWMLANWAVYSGFKLVKKLAKFLDINRNVL